MTESNITPLINGNNGFMLHASSVNIKDKAIVFLGHSTSGKSTIAQLLSRQFPLISDDKIIMFKSDGKWFVKSGDEERKFLEYKKKIPFVSGCFPILSFIRIYKSENNNMHKIESNVLCKSLIDAVFEVDNQRSINNTGLRKHWFRLSAELARNIQGWHFYFKKESNIIRIINKTFEK